ncbi:MAG: cellulase family glycosylhydrolase [Prolixibacteraceae bacterium]|nr:cellulase family glycosylhydrolase [Prolixibacteraceae bacterium]
MKNIFLFLTALFFLSGCNNRENAGFLHTNGKKIVDATGNEVILRGMGFGGWMLQEGYMLQTSAFAGPQHEIKNTIAELIGPESTEEFYQAWRNNYCTREDVDEMASWGFNSIRLPMHYNLFTLPIEEEPVIGKDTWLDTGFDMIDELLEWCAANEVYLILDLHAAPGGQGKDANISDYDKTKPSLWESKENQRKTIALWQKLAERYADEPWIGGYDLINEPNWDFDNAGNKNGCNCTENVLLWDFYKRAIDAVREVDQNHIVIIEGNCWGNNYKGVPNVNSFDDNLVLSFHKYWNFNIQEEIQYILDMREKYNVPIWLGESGENSNTWFTNAINLVESHGIGWAWWPFKKIGSVTGTITIPKTEGYNNLLQYWRGNAPKPDVGQAKEWLMEQAEMMKLENCMIHYDVIDAMFRQAQGDKSPIPFKEHNIPGTVFAADYDLGANGYAYLDTDTANYRVSTQKHTGWNNGHSYRNDGVDIERCNDKPGNGFSVGWTEKGEWLNYTIHSNTTGNYVIELRYNGAGSVLLQIDDKKLTPTKLPCSADWKSVKLGETELEKGTYRVKIIIDDGGVNLNCLKFKINDKTIY